ncbi:hypothetical protein EW026_g5361 [Hermanssonia centrifuga]|uniref:Protein kinase domain-containing protein n=1 Tax=Hermanssonia centrifuga TaxID=98765 RepID=A0A4S4KEA0_9APHY|nr:hypothetical protein EW026_g5361 [Hermanssonia centrifuga]
MLSSSRFSGDPRNHCVPVLDYFVDKDDTSIAYMVMPFLRLTDDPPFETVNDIIDYGSQIIQSSYMISRWRIVRLPTDSPKLVVGGYGRDQDVPELSFDVPYDPFKVDIFILGNMFKREIYNNSSNVDFLLPFVNAMTQNDPKARPDALEAEKIWGNTCAKICKDDDIVAVLYC